MSNNRLIIDSRELQEGLRQLLESVAGTGEAGHIVEATGNRAAADIKQGYPVRTGNLRDHVDMDHTASAFGAQSVVKNTAKHALIFENGTDARHTDLGANRGSMPPGHVFIPAMIRHRRAMYEQLAELLRRNGLIVTSDAR